MNGSIERVLRPYLWVLMGGLLVQGAGSLIFRLIPALPEHSPLLVRGAFGIDFWHALIHIAWGAAGVAVLRASISARPLILLTLVFGVFYTAFGLWGSVQDHPLGLELDLPENLFHLVAGPLSLVIGGWCLRRNGSTVRT
jgi:Domain of unknown function (DUF4383)